MDIERSYRQLIQYLDGDVPVMTAAKNLLENAGRSGTVARMSGISHEDHTNKDIFELTISRTDLDRKVTPEEAEYRAMYQEALRELGKLIAPIILLQVRQINDFDPAGNAERSLVALGERSPYRKSRAVFDQTYPIIRPRALEVA